MRLAPIRPGDIVAVEKAGGGYYATVREKRKGELDLAPLSSSFAKWRPVTASTARPREVVGHWRHRAGGAPHV